MPAELPQRDQVSAAFPLSSGQKSLWLMQQVLPDSAVYHIALAIRVLSPLDVPALRSALQTILDRHESLRTVFGMDARGELTQTVRSRGPVAFETVDTAGFSRDEIDAKVTAVFRRPFDLATGPLFRSHLFTNSADYPLLLITAHHLVFDALSLVRVFTELLELYGDAPSGKSSSLIPIKATYRDFVEWQAQMLAGPEGDAHLAFWREQLEGAPPILDLPTDRPRPSHPSGRGGSLWFPIEDDLVQGLRALAADLGVHLYDVFAAAWQVLLCRYSGQTDVLVGFVTGGRPHLRYGRTTGSFSNTIVLRARLGDDPTFADFVRLRHENLAQCLAHQDYPFPMVVEKLQPDRVPGYMPLTQVLFTYFMARGSQLSELFVSGHEPARVQAEAFAMESYGLKQEDVEFDLALSVAEGKRCWSRIRFDTDLFDQGTVERHARHYLNLLTRVAGESSQTVSSIPLLGKVEREETLSRWDRMEVAHRAAPTVCRLFEAQVEATPDRIAVACGNRRLTYAELNGRADLLAAYLQDSGVCPESLVGVCLERSVDMLVALLAVWKAGAAYVPLDPHSPKARLDLIVEDAAPQRIITEATLADSTRNAKPVRHSLGRSELAYVIYTSGSTGKPKGVEIRHSAFTNFLLSMRKRPGISPDDVLLAVTTLGFDIAGLELFLPVIAGASVIIAERDTILDGKSLAREIESRGITMMQATPATWRLLVDSGWTGCSRLTALCGGEAWASDLARKLMPRVRSLWNMYGPTETTVWSAVHQVGTEDDLIPLGTPIENTAFYLLDKHLEPVPTGVAGELHIGGAGLARGYRNLDDLTKAQFTTNPFLPGERLYKTGDLCRARADGSILFLGRLDDQVKLRGHRIELGEIESSLLRHPVVREAAVVLDRRSDSSERLIAYLVATVEQPAGTLREFLSSQLPDYMIPSAFVYLDSLPLTPNSKVDRKALLRLSAIESSKDGEYAEPRTPTEKAVAEIWTETLKAKRVGAHDRFDELGGDSLSFALMTLRAGTQLGIKLPVRMDGDRMTLAGFARAADLIASELPAGNAPATALRPDPLARTWYGQALLRACSAIVRCLARVEIDGLENIPTSGPAILAANHISLFDLVILGSALARLKQAVPITPTFVIAHKWRWLAQPYVSHLGHTIYIRRGQGDMEALAAAREVLTNHGVVAITPEGRPTRGALTRAKPGIAYLACETGVSVWPLAVFGHDRIFTFLKRLRRVPVTIRLGQSLTLTDPVGKCDFQQPADAIMKAIASLMPPEYHGIYGDSASSPKHGG